MFKVCAIMSVFNEEDIINESVTKLIKQGCDVFILDNGSTDGTISKIQNLIGKGVINVETVRHYEDGKEVYNWTEILRAKAELSKKLEYSWFLHVDADEIRYSPWEELSLSEGIEKVNHHGYSLIDFKLFNFRLTENSSYEGDIETNLQHYSYTEKFNSFQIKAWKKSDSVNIDKHGGHIITVNNSQVYPVKFIHKHYPIRSIEQGKRKIQSERKNRFSKAELLQGWHVQYKDYDENSLKGIVWDTHDLKEFNMKAELFQIYKESLDFVAPSLSTLSQLETDGLRDLLYRCKQKENDLDQAKYMELLDLSIKISYLLTLGQLPPIQIDESDRSIILNILKLKSTLDYLNANPFVMQRLNDLQFV